MNSNSRNVFSFVWGCEVLVCFCEGGVHVNIHTEDSRDKVKKRFLWAALFMVSLPKT